MFMILCDIIGYCWDLVCNAAVWGWNHCFISTLGSIIFCAGVILYICWSDDDIFNEDLTSAHPLRSLYCCTLAALFLFFACGSIVYGIRSLYIVDQKVEVAYVKYKAINKPEIETRKVAVDTQKPNEIQTIVKTTIVQNGVERTATIDLKTDELTSDNIKNINKSIGETYQKLNEQRLTETN